MKHQMTYILGYIAIAAGTIIALIGVMGDNNQTVFYSGVAILFAGIAITTSIKKQRANQ